jgi:hypothetical protein
MAVLSVPPVTLAVMSDTTDSGSLVIDPDLLADLRALAEQAGQLHLDLCEVYPPHWRYARAAAKAGGSRCCTCRVEHVLRRLLAWHAVHGDEITPLPAGVSIRVTGRDQGSVEQVVGWLAGNGLLVRQRHYADRASYRMVRHGAILATRTQPQKPQEAR